MFPTDLTGSEFRRVGAATEKYPVPTYVLTLGIEVDYNSMIAHTHACTHARTHPRMHARTHARAYRYGHARTEPRKMHVTMDSADDSCVICDWVSWIRTFEMYYRRAVIFEGYPNAHNLFICSTRKRFFSGVGNSAETFGLLQWCKCVWATNI